MYLCEVVIPQKTTLPDYNEEHITLPTFNADTAKGLSGIV